MDCIFWHRIEESDGIEGAGHCGAEIVVVVVDEAVAVHVTDTALLVAWTLPPPVCSIFALYDFVAGVLDVTAISHVVPVPHEVILEAPSKMAMM